MVANSDEDWLPLLRAASLARRGVAHANIRTTLETYGHLNVDDLRGPLETVGKSTAAPETRLPTPLPARAAANLGPIGVQAVAKPKNRGPGPKVATKEDRALEVGAEHRVRTGDLRLGKATSNHRTLNGARRPISGGRYRRRPL